MNRKLNVLQGVIQRGQVLTGGEEFELQNVVERIQVNCCPVACLIQCADTLSKELIDLNQFIAGRKPLQYYIGQDMDSDLSAKAGIDLTTGATAVVNNALMCSIRNTRERTEQLVNKRADVIRALTAMQGTDLNALFESKEGFEVPPKPWWLAVAQAKRLSREEEEEANNFRPIYDNNCLRELLEALEKAVHRCKFQVSTGYDSRGLSVHKPDVSMTVMVQFYHFLLPRGDSSLGTSLMQNMWPAVVTNVRQYKKLLAENLNPASSGFSSSVGSPSKERSESFSPPGRGREVAGRSPDGGYASLSAQPSRVDVIAPRSSGGYLSSTSSATAAAQQSFHRGGR